MPCLNQDILFAIGKKLVESGDYDAAAKVALSGKEPFHAMKAVFASVTTLGLYKDYYSVGWGVTFSKYKFEVNKPYSIVFSKYMGNCVNKLHMDFGNIPIYQPIIDKIIAKKKLISFSAGCCCYASFLDQFLPIFASTLKNIAIQGSKMTSIFRDTFNLDSLTVLAADGNDINDLMKYIPSTEAFQMNLLKRFTHTLNVRILCDIHKLVKFVQSATKVPSKITFCFYKFHKNMDFPYLFECKKICEGFEFDETITDFSCFRKTVQSAGTQSTIFEVQFFYK